MNNLGVAYTADVTDLQVKSAIAKAEVRALTTEMNSLAKASAGGMGAEVAPQLQQVAGELNRAKAEAASLNAEMKELNSSSVNIGETLEDMHSKLTQAFQVTGIGAMVEGLHIVGEMLEQVGERATQIHSMSDVLGVTGAEFQAMSAAAEEAGVSDEMLFRAAEKLNTTMIEARNNSGAAADKLMALGLTAEQVNDPTFKLNDALQVLHERLIDTSTKQQEMNLLSQEFGSRAALVAEALTKYDGSAEGVKEVMEELGGVTDAQISKVQKGKIAWNEFGTEIKNESLKIMAAMSDMMPTNAAAEAAEATHRLIEQERIEDEQDAKEAQALARETARQEMENARAGVAAFKQGTQEKLQQLQIYAAAAENYYKSSTVDAVVKANQEIIAEQRAVNEAEKASYDKQRAQLQELTDFTHQLTDDVTRDKAQAAALEAKYNAEYVKQAEKDLQELSDYAEKLYVDTTNKKATLLKQENAETAKAAKEDSKSWQGVVGEIESAESTMVSDILGKRKSLSQSLIQLSGHLIETEISNDLKAMTTRALLANTAANQQKAAEQGGLLYHMFTTNAATNADLVNNARQTSATISSQAAQTNAVAAGNAARTASTTAAAASASATSSAMGSKTVMQDAAKAFSGVYASVSQIPYVGWILAPIAASAAFAGVAAYEGLASLDTGTNYVPRDMVAQLHEGERVTPKAYNPDANPQLATAGGYSEEHNYYGATHISAFDAQSVARQFTRPGYRSGLVQGAVRALKRGAR